MDDERRLKILWDNYATMEGMYKKGYDEGYKKGLELARRKSMLEEAREMVKRLKDMGVSSDLIAKITKLSPQEIEKL